MHLNFQRIVIADRSQGLQLSRYAICAIVPFMTDEDFRNLEHSIDRHEGDLDQQLKRIEVLEKQLSELAKENAGLRDSLGKTVILLQRVFVSIRTDPS